MSKRGQDYYTPYPGQPQIVPNQHDVLSGRGVNIAQHAGNERFRALIHARNDSDYCHSYTTSEKRAVAEEIINHLKNLNPPGRFLRRPGRSKNSRGLEGPWEILSEKEAIKKTCQALRDCNRPDRTGYAASIVVPPDVKNLEEIRSQTGMSNKQLAQIAAAKAKKQAEEAAAMSGKRPRSVETIPSNSYATATNWGSISPSVENAAEWLKRQKTSQPLLEFKTPLPPATLDTPTTAPSTGMMNETSILHTRYHSPSEMHEQSYQANQQDFRLSSHFGVNGPSSPSVVDTTFNDPFSVDEFMVRRSTDPIGLNFTSSEFDPVNFHSDPVSTVVGQQCQAILSSHTVEQSFVEAGHDRYRHTDSFLNSTNLDQDVFPPSPMHQNHSNQHHDHGEFSDNEFV